MSLLNVPLKRCNLKAGIADVKLSLGFSLKRDLDLLMPTWPDMIRFWQGFGNHRLSSAYVLGKVRRVGKLCKLH